MRPTTTAPNRSELHSHLERPGPSFAVDASQALAAVLAPYRARSLFSLGLLMQNNPQALALAASTLLRQLSEECGPEEAGLRLAVALGLLLGSASHTSEELAQLLDTFTGVTRATAEDLYEQKAHAEAAVTS